MGRLPLQPLFSVRLPFSSLQRQNVAFSPSIHTSLHPWLDSKDSEKIFPRASRIHAVQTASALAPAAELELGGSAPSPLQAADLKSPPASPTRSNALVDKAPRATELTDPLTRRAGPALHLPLPAPSRVPVSGGRRGQRGALRRVRFCGFCLGLREVSHKHIHSIRGQLVQHGNFCLAFQCALTPRM